MSNPSYDPNAKPEPFDESTAHISNTSVAVGNVAAAAATPSGLLPAKWAAILGIVATVAFGAASFVPPPFGGLVEIVAFVLAGLSGASLPAPSWVAGKPVVQGAAVGIATTATAVLEASTTSLPEGPWKLGASALALVAAWLAGCSAPQLGGARAP